ncbi:MAG: hypothetical protein ACRDSH_11520 [Pseudonocardiaceae bacterium]
MNEDVGGVVPSLIVVAAWPAVGGPGSAAVAGGVDEAGAPVRCCLDH